MKSDKQRNWQPTVEDLLEEWVKWVRGISDRQVVTVSLLRPTDDRGLAYSSLLTRRRRSDTTWLFPYSRVLQKLPSFR